MITVIIRNYVIVFPVATYDLLDSFDIRPPGAQQVVRRNYIYVVNQVRSHEML